MIEYLICMTYTVIISFLLLLLYIPKKIIKVTEEISIVTPIIIEKEIEKKEIEEKYDPDAIAMTGELYKLGSNETIRSWKLRDFVLIGNILQYYDLPHNLNDTSKGDFDITDSFVRKSSAEECNNKAANFSFIVYNGRGKLVLLAASEPERELWMLKLTKQIRLYHRLLQSIKLAALRDSNNNNSNNNVVEEFDTEKTPNIEVYKKSHLR